MAEIFRCPSRPLSLRRRGRYTHNADGRERGTVPPYGIRIVKAGSNVTGRSHVHITLNCMWTLKTTGNAMKDATSDETPPGMNWVSQRWTRIRSLEGQ